MGHVSPVSLLHSVRAFDDDGSEHAMTPKAAVNAAVAIGEAGHDTNIIGRFLVQETNGGSLNNQNADLEYRVNGGAWNDVDGSTSLYVRVFPSSNITDEADTTTGANRIGSGTYITDNNWMDDSDGIAGACSFAGNDEAESLHCFQIRSADTSDGDTIEVRTTSTGSAWDGENNFLTFNISRDAPVTVGAPQVMIY